MGVNVRELLIKYISKFSFSELMKASGNKNICIECKNFKWITQKECSYNWGWRCTMLYNLSLGTCRGKEFNPKDRFLKELKGE